MQTTKQTGNYENTQQRKRVHKDGSYDITLKYEVVEEWSVAGSILKKRGAHIENDLSM